MPTWGGGGDVPWLSLPGGTGTGLRELRLVGLGATAAAEGAAGPLPAPRQLQRLGLQDCPLHRGALGCPATVG